MTGANSVHGDGASRTSPMESHMGTEAHAQEQTFLAAMARTPAIVKPTIRTLWLAAVTVLALLGFSSPIPDAIAQDATRKSVVYVLTFDGPITPVLLQYLEGAADAAVAEDAEAVILQIDTPGGSVAVTKSITQFMLAAPIPVVVFVAPSGAQAGSAGTFVVLAAHVAAMAPQSSIGAASPVDISGADIDDTMRNKMENMLSADVENLASRRGEEATEWAISAVREAEAATAERALAMGVIDLIAADVDDLLDKLDGFEVSVNGMPETLHTAGVEQKPIQLSPLQQLLNFLSDPTVATLLLSLGLLGLFVEIRTPGFGFAGVVGILSLLFAFFGLGQLDANLVGMALIAVALALFVAEAFTPTFGALALGGVAAFIFGAALLFNTPGIQTPWTTIIVVAIAAGAFVVFIGAKAMAAQRKKPVTGAEALIGANAHVKDGFSAGEHGSVFLKGEWWNAYLAAGSVKAGEEVRVVARDGYTLVVEPTDGEADLG